MTSTSLSPALRARARLGAALVLATALAAGVLPAAPAASATIAPSAAAPDFTLATTAGQNLRLKEQRGKVVLINFWASWCSPCRQEMPHLNRLFDRYQAAGFQLLGVNIDDDPRKAEQLAGKWDLRFPVLLDAGKQVSRLYDLGTMPSTVLVDRDGKVRFVHRGYREGLEQDYEQQIRLLLKE